LLSSSPGHVWRGMYLRRVITGDFLVLLLHLAQST
jgi:hypothetical protein